MSEPAAEAAVSDEPAALGVRVQISASATVTHPDGTTDDDEPEPGAEHEVGDGGPG